MIIAEGETLTVRQIMSRNVLTAFSHSNVGRAVRIMAVNNIGSVVIIDSSGPRGIFTERDLLSKVLCKGRTSQNTLLMEVLSPIIATVSPDQSPQEAARAMIDKKSRLMVFEGGEMVGLLTASDIVRAIHSMGSRFDIERAITKKPISVDATTPVDTVIRDMDAKRIGSVLVSADDRPYGIFTERDLLTKVIARDMPLNTPVGEFCSMPLVTLQHGISGKEVARVMVEERIKRLPICQNGEVMGIVTARDLVEAFVDSASNPTPSPGEQ